MQRTILDFLESNAQPETLPFSNDSHDEDASKKRSRDTGFAEKYPVRSRVCQSVSVNLRLLDPRFYSRHHTRCKYAQLASTQSCIAADGLLQVRQVTSSMHPTRRNEEGEPLISSVDTFKNCVTDIVWDPKDDFFIATRRSRFQLFGASALLDSNADQTEHVAPLLDLRAATVQTRLGAENKISFGLSSAQFLGNTLNTICIYNGTSQIDMFDLEDLDEETGEPLHSFNLASIFPNEEQSATNTAPTATSIVTLSDTLAIAALSNGCSAYVDTRAAAPIVCTRFATQSDIISSLGAFAGRKQRRHCSTALAVVGSSCELQMVTGTKNGMVELWDLRKSERPIASISIGGSIESLQSARSNSSGRCGAPTVWLNTDCGELFCLSIGAGSFETVSHVETKDTRRSHSSANLAPPKISIMASSRSLLYPHISSNTVLFYDMDDHFRENGGCERKSATIHTTRREDLKVDRSSKRSEFVNAHTLLLDQESALFGDVSSLGESASRVRGLTLVRSLLFNEWAPQICSVSAAKRHDAVVVGGDDGDLHLLTGLES